MELRCLSQVGRQLIISRKPLSVFGKICYLWLISDSIQARPHHYDYRWLVCTGGQTGLQDQEEISFYTIAT